MMGVFVFCPPASVGLCTNIAFVRYSPLNGLSCSSLFTITMVCQSRTFTHTFFSLRELCVSKIFDCTSDWHSHV